MDLLGEFLESSTIHGLAYISTAKVYCNLYLTKNCNFLFSDKDWKESVGSCSTHVFLVVFGLDLRIIR